MSTTVPAAAATTPLTVVLIGNPNTGKSTLFNGLTQGRARIGNFPGVTVEKKTGRFREGDREVQLVDLPGTYSLSPRSADEIVSVDVLLGRHPELGHPDAVVCIVDSTNLERNLYLFSQLRDLRIPVLLVLNMWDLAQSRGISIDVEKLRQNLGVEVLTASATRRGQLPAVKEAILRVAGSAELPAVRLLPEAFYQETDKLAEYLAEQGQAEVPFYLRERMLLDVHGAAEHRATQQVQPEVTNWLHEARARLAAAGCRIPMVETQTRYQWIREQLQGVVTRKTSAEEFTASDHVDRILTHRFAGLVFFVLVMLVVFQAIFAWATPLMDLVEAGQGWVASGVQSVIPPGSLRSLLVDGIVAGVGSVVIFVPQIVLLFLFIAILEDCGYMARAAFLMDKLMTRIGLSGKSFLPLMSSFACAIPGVMATRVIENRRDRMVTILVAPLMSCSARLPVYVLLVSAFVPPVAWANGWIGLQGLVYFAMYSLGALIAIPVAWLLKKTFFRGETPPFVMELPPYQWPSPRVVLTRVYEQAAAFLVRAGTLIFCVSVLIWAAGYFPADHSELHQVQRQLEQLEDSEGAATQRQSLLERENQLSATLIRDSYLGRAGKWIEPAVRPLGWDWRIGVGAVASFPAREVIVATMGTIFSLGGDVDEENTDLISTLQAATWPNGEPLITIPVAFSIMVFFALCAQCGATLLVIRRETNSWRWPLFTFTYMTLLAYVGAFVTYQVGTAIMG